MGDWLLAHGAAIQAGVLLAAFAAVALWESFRPRAALVSATAVR